MVISIRLIELDCCPGGNDILESRHEVPVENDSEEPYHELQTGFDTGRLQ